MNQTITKIHQQLASNLFLATLVFMHLPAQEVQATPLDLATIPLANSPTVHIQPNLLFIMDDSGSMGWDYMPDWANTPDISLKQNASYNTMAYNPSIRYDPPVFFTAGGQNTTQYPSQTGMATATGANSASKPNWRAVKDNPFTSAATSNLETDSSYAYTIPGEYCTKSDLRVCVTQTSPTATHPYPASARWCNSSANANAATPATNSCQASRLTGFTNLRMPAQRAATITVTTTSNNTNLVTSITVDGKQILSAAANGATNNGTGRNTTASNIAAGINACTYNRTGNCTVAGYRATTASNVVTIWGPTTFSGGLSIGNSGTFAASTTNFTKSNPNVPGERVFVPITNTANAYPLPGSAAKSSGRTDCAGATCTYVEEMTNYANWWAYYHTRAQTMKTAASLAFKDIGEDFRVGFMTTSTRATYMLDFDTFNNAQKSAWYQKLFGAPFDRNTPLRGALSKAGRIYANQTTAKRGKFTDPMEYECQQNFTLLTTDGYWNEQDETTTYAGGPVNVQGTANVGNLDSAADNTPRPLREGSVTVANTLADVAKYYYDTDLRTPTLGNCTGANGTNVCQSPVSSSVNKKQNMVTMTLGMGIDGTLSYTTDYKTATSGDFFDIKNGSKDWPDPIANTQAERIDDLWHAAVNGGGTYFSAKNPADLINQLKEALATIEVKLGAGAAAATSTLNPIAGDNAAYVASYTTGNWTGNLEKRNIDISSGAVGVSAVSCVEDVVSRASCSSPSSIVADGNGGYHCVTPGVIDAGACSGVLDGTDCKVPVVASCGGKLKNLVSNFTDSRTIYMKSGSGLVNFSFSNMTTTQKQTYSQSYLAVNLTQWPLLTETQRQAVTGENLVAYLRGQKGFEESATAPENRIFRNRQTVMGDLVDSTPAFVGKPTFSYTDPGYETFKTAQAGRARTVYVGSNDGMLHAFDAETLQERWAYVPSMVISNMWKLADTAYANKHAYYANGEPVISDICISACNSGSAVWRTILVAGLNGGGRGYYALDITNPLSPTLLWEVDADSEPNLGYTYGSPVITKRPDGKWVVLVTSGYNNIPDNNAFYTLPSTKFKPNNPALYINGDGGGYLYVRDAYSGVKLVQIATGEGTVNNPSGLAKIQAYTDDGERNNTTTYVYGGDLFGNLWRFNLNNNSVMKFARLFSGASPQPITTRPELGAIKNKRVVFIGTGKYLEVSDLTNTNQQTLYAIKDDDIATTLVDPRGQLVQQTVVPVGADARKSGTSNGVSFDAGLGWYVDFPDAGERQNVAAQLVLGTLMVPTLVPTSSACQPAGYGWFNYFDYRTGLSVVRPSGLVSQITTAPIVGFNVTYIGGNPKVSLVEGNRPDPEPPKQDIPFSGSGTGFQKTRAIWRELTN